MKALKIIGGVLGGLIVLIGLAATIFYFGWLKEPPRDEVCNNTVKLLLSEYKGEVATAAEPGVRKQCMEMQKSIFTGQIPWVESLKCMRDAKDLAGLKACDKRKS